jgi:methyltransferase domain protein
MLTMQGEKGKAAIVSEANRILATGGRYAIHELLLTPNNVDQTVADNLRKALATTIKVNARPLTATEWSELLESNGFKVLSIKVAPMGLLQPKQMIEDEGPRVLKIMFNLARNPQARKRVLAMRKVFSENAQNLGAISIIAEKVSDVKPAETAASEAPEPEASPKVTESKPQDSKPAADDPKANDSKAETPSKPAAPNEAAAPSKTAADKVVEPSKAETAKTTAPKATAHKATSTTAETEAAAPKVEASKKAEATPANSAQAGADTSKKPEDKKPEAAQDATPKKAVPKPHDPRTRNKKS